MRPVQILANQYHQGQSCILTSWVSRISTNSQGRNLFRTHGESCFAYQWVVSHVLMSHVSHIKESCLTYQWVMSRITRSHVSHINEACLTYLWVMSLITRSHVSHITESCLTYQRVMSHILCTHKPMYKAHRPASLICETWHDSFICDNQHTHKSM